MLLGCAHEPLLSDPNLDTDRGVPKAARLGRSCLVRARLRLDSLNRSFQSIDGVTPLTTGGADLTVRKQRQDLASLGDLPVPVDELNGNHLIAAEARGYRRSGDPGEHILRA